jgi:phosphatidylinositol glycan class O
VGLAKDDLVFFRSLNYLTKACSTRRLVDSLSIVIVDALRFQTALLDLPRLLAAHPPTGPHTTTQLRRFKADPPTLTTQRIKGLTTGGLPTFADVTSTFSTGAITEDNWLNQLYRNYGIGDYGIGTGDNDDEHEFQKSRPKIAYAGDDTWSLLFPPSAADQALAYANADSAAYHTTHHSTPPSHIPYFDGLLAPYPSFNTRDINGVDDGIKTHLPFLLSNRNDAVVTLTHWLGVDHVGHTYGAAGEEMTKKVAEIDRILKRIVDSDESKASATGSEDPASPASSSSSASSSCRATLIFGDHGMTESGNHGGGTKEETTAGLYVHFTPSCDFGSADPVTGIDANNPTVFEQVNQVDIVPTISFLLGLPIPFANIGSSIVSLLPVSSTEATLGLAINAAQVANYLEEYEKEKGLPSRDMDKLREQLHEASEVFKTAVASHRKAADAADATNDTIYSSADYHMAATLFKEYLRDATELGRSVWTSFNYYYMVAGIVFLVAGVFLAGPYRGISPDDPLVYKLTQTDVVAATPVALALFHTLFMFLSNSYIISEQQFCQMALLVVCVSQITKHHEDWLALLLIPTFSRLHEYFVSGHGVDVTNSDHLAHNPLFFLPVSAAMTYTFVSIFHTPTPERHSISPIVLPFIFVNISWLQNYFGYPGWVCANISFYLPTVMAIVTCFSSNIMTASENAALLSIALLTVTGPAAVSSLLLLVCQIGFLTTKIKNVHPCVQAVMFRFAIRHAFYTTSHACSFSALQYNSAFVLSDKFSYWYSGMMLFLNTFGWDIVMLTVMYHKSKAQTVKWYRYLTYLEVLGSTLAVTIFRRHLMIYGIFAPRYYFSLIFAVVSEVTWWLTRGMSSWFFGLIEWSEGVNRRLTTSGKRRKR